MKAGQIPLETLHFRFCNVFFPVAGSLCPVGEGGGIKTQVQTTGVASLLSLLSLKIILMKKIFLLIVFLIALVPIQAQGGFQQFFNESMSANRTGMYVLGGWALANLATGAVGWANTEGSTRYFHQMNFFWNTINLGIAGYSFYAFSQLTPMRMSPQELMDQHMLYEKLFLVNAGLDIAYAGTGFLLRHLSERNTKRPEMLMGYGNSLVLQGGFLFLFDGFMYFIQRGNRLDFLGDMQLGMVPGGAVLHFTHLF